MSLEYNKGARRKSEALNYYFTFPVQSVNIFDLEIQEEVEEFITLHKELVRWWLGGYIPSYVEDLKNIVAHPRDPEKWTTTGQEEVEKTRLKADDIITSEGQAARPPVGAENESEPVQQLEEQPARSLVGAENEAETLQQNDPESLGDGICQGITRRNARCRAKVKTGKYCFRHKKEE